MAQRIPMDGIGNPTRPAPRRGALSVALSSRATSAMGRARPASGVCECGLGPDPPPPPSLKTVPVPEPANLGEFVATRPPRSGWARPCSGTCRWAATASRPAPPATSTPAPTAARRTSSARACSTARRPIAPSTPPAGAELPAQRCDDFPFRELSRSSDRDSAPVLRHERRRLLAGRLSAMFIDAKPGRAEDVVEPAADPDGFTSAASMSAGSSRGTRRRVINAVFNHRNFWDGRAQNEFNGVNAWGTRDPSARLYKATKPNELVPGARSGSRTRASPRRRWRRRRTHPRCRRTGARSGKSAISSARSGARSWPRFGPWRSSRYTPRTRCSAH